MGNLLLKKPTSGTFCQGVVGDKGPDGTAFLKRTNKFKYLPLKNGRIDWDVLPITEGLDIEKKESVLYNCDLMYNYMSQNNVKLHVFSVNIGAIMWPLLRKIANDSTEKISNPEKFYAYCIEYIKKIYPHYENVSAKSESEQHPHPCIDIEACITRDLAENIVSILKQDSDE